MEPLIRKYLSTWTREKPLDPRAWLADHGASPTVENVQQFVVVDFECRWRAGLKEPVEVQLARFPEMRQRKDAIVALVAVEWRFTVAEPELPRYRERFPTASAELDELHKAYCLLGRSYLDGDTAGDAAIGSRATSLDGDATARDSKATPERIGRYVVDGELGRGGMGIVYRARQEGLDRLVALKVIRAATDVGENARFTREAHAIARLNHPNILQVYEIGESQAYLALEYCDGGSLARRLDGTPWQAAGAAELVETLARAAAAAHDAGIVHRDLKPANVLFRDGVPKIGDFGLAKVADDLGDQTESGVVVGTPSYMAPEQAVGDRRAIGPPADVYALGAILYELLTGRPPFRAATTIETLDQVRHHDPVSIRSLQPATPIDLETICQKCLQKIPDQRYASAHELANDLERFRNNVPIVARPVSRIERVVRWSRRNPSLAAALAACLGIFLIGFASVVWQWRRAEVNAANERLARTQTETAQRLVQETADAERTARLREAKSRRRAESAQQKLAKAVDRFLFVADESSVLQQPGMEGVQVDLVKEAVDYYEAFAKEDDTGLFRREQTLAMTRLSRLHDRSSNNAQAVEWAERAIDRFEKDVELGAEGPQPFLDLAAAWNSLGTASVSKTNVPKGEKAFRQCLSQVEEAVKRGATREQTDLLVATSKVGLGRLAYSKFDFKLAEALLREAERIDLSKAKGAAAEQAHRELPHHLANVGQALNAPDVDARFRLAIQRYREAIKTNPKNASARVSLGQIYYDRGKALVEKSPREAIEHLQSSVKIRRQLANEFPTWQPLRLSLAVAHTRLAAAQVNGKRDLDAQYSLAEAEAAFEASGIHPSKIFHYDLWDVYWNWATLSYRMGDSQSGLWHLNRAMRYIQLVAAERHYEPRVIHRMSMVVNKLAIELKATGRHSDAANAYQSILDRFEKLPLNEREESSTQVAIPGTYWWTMASMQLCLHRFSDAEANFRIALGKIAAELEHGGKAIIVFDAARQVVHLLHRTIWLQGRFEEAEKFSAEWLARLDALHEREGLRGMAELRKTIASEIAPYDTTDAPVPNELQPVRLRLDRQLRHAAELVQFGDFAAATVAAADAVAGAERLVESDPAWRGVLGSAQFVRAKALAGEMKFDLAMKAINGAIDAFEKDLNNSPNDAERQIRLANGHRQAGEFFARRGDFAGAVAPLETAAKILDTAIAGAPSDELLVQRAECERNLVTVLRRGKASTVKKVVKHLDRTIELAERIPRKVEWEQKRSNLLVDCYLERASVHLNAKNYPLAIFDLDRLLTKTPTPEASAAIRIPLSRGLIGIGWGQVGLDALEPLVQKISGAGERHVEIASCFALAASKQRDGEKLTVIGASNARRACELLDAALALGFFKTPAEKARLDRDDFAALADFSAFVAIRKRIDARVAK